MAWLRQFRAIATMCVILKYARVFSNPVRVQASQAYLISRKRPLLTS
jgi:hypothetical protein